MSFLPKKFNKPKNLTYYVLFPLSFMLLIFFSWLFYNETTNTSIEEIRESLITNSTRNSFSSNEVFANYQDMISFAAITWPEDDVVTEDLSLYYQELVGSLLLDELLIVHGDKTNYVYSEKSISKREYRLPFSYADLQSDTGITDVFVADNYYECVAIYSKIDQEDSFIVGLVSLDTLQNYFSSTFIDYGGYFHIVDTRGNYIVTKESDEMLVKSDNYYDDMKNLNFHNEYSYDKLVTDIQNKKPVYVEYNVDTHTRYSSVVPLDINGWCFMNITTDTYVQSQLSTTNYFSLIYTFCIFATIIIMFLLFYQVSQQQRKETRRYNRYFTAISKHLGQLVIEIDFAKSYLKSNSNDEEVDNSTIFMLLKDIIVNNNGENTNKYIHSSDLTAWTEFTTKLKSNEDIENILVRVLNSDNQYVWYHTTGFSIISGGNPKKAVLLFENVDTQIKEQLDLKHKGEIDALSGLYNKSAGEIKIRQILSNSEKTDEQHALLVIDLDNFKNINDKLGHATGDRVILEVAQKIKATFRSNDIVSRFGGDEFIVLLNNYKDLDLVKKKCENLCEALMLTYSNNSQSVRISCSIGCSLFPKDSNDYGSLFKNADHALYEAKKAGKNGYSIYKYTT